MSWHVIRAFIIMPVMRSLWGNAIKGILRQTQDNHPASMSHGKHCSSHILSETAYTSKSEEMLSGADLHSSPMGHLSWRFH